MANLAPRVPNVRSLTLSHPCKLLQAFLHLTFLKRAPAYAHSVCCFVRCSPARQFRCFRPCALGPKSTAVPMWHVQPLHGQMAVAHIGLLMALTVSLVPCAGL